MLTLDANIFVRNMDVRDPQHAACHALLAAIQARHVPLICPQILLPEVAEAVRRTWNDATRGRLAAQLVGTLPNLTLVSVDEGLAQEAAELAADYALRGMDAIYVAVARRYGCILITLDEDPLRRVHTIVRVHTPDAPLTALPQT